MRRSTTVAVDAALLDQANALDIDLTGTMETALRRAIAAAKADRWQSENADAIAQYNAWVEEHGLPLARYRQF